MKFKILAAGLLLAASTSIPACTELEDTNYHAIVGDGFQPTDADLAALLASAYIPWRQTFLQWNGVARSQMLTADEDVIPARPNGWVDGGIYKRLHQHEWTSDEDIVVQGWNRTYVGINACNRVLYQIENGIDLGEQHDAIVSELKVLRASYYYILVDLFGNVPIITQFDVPDGFLPTQSKRSEVYEFIIKELTENIDNLSETVGGEYYGRFNKWAAYALLAKMYLNAEVFSDGTHSEWDKCVEACDKIIESGKYGLESKQSLCFITNNENSCESIFALVFDETYVTDWNAFDYHLYSLQPANQQTYNFESAPWGGVCAIPQYVDSFDPDDARLESTFIKGQQFSFSGETLYCTLGSYSGQPLAYVNEVPSIDESEEIHGYRWGKFEYATGITNRLSNDFPVFRYADVLLMKAEALLRNGKADDAAALVTDVRRRNFPGNEEKATVTGQQLQSETTYKYGRADNLTEHTTSDVSVIKYGRMLDELGWEFSQEGRRRQDMVRFGAFTTMDWFSHSASDETKNLFPIPNAQLLTNSNLKQNPGY
ncbi:MAG: RagB/SusD family nutrient uptake outer membrane protein [Bacteroidales bacterium]|nr:RagB/SusD family nutrient uptake outer membrane protein [Bacteroidales bacterium]